MQESVETELHLMGKHELIWLIMELKKTIKGNAETIRQLRSEFEEAIKQRDALAKWQQAHPEEKQ